MYQLNFSVENFADILSTCSSPLQSEEVEFTLKKTRGSSLKFQQVMK